MMKRPKSRLTRCVGWDRRPISRAEFKADLHDPETPRWLRCKIYAELRWRRENGR